MEFELPQDFKELFELLNSNNVKYLLIGGYAVGIYGYARSTNDIDIFISDEPENITKLGKSLEQFGFGRANLPDALFAQGRSLVEMGIEPMKVQLMNFADGIDFTEAFEQRNVVRIEDIEVNVISRENLMKNKKASGRYKDLADIERLEEID